MRTGTRFVLMQTRIYRGANAPMIKPVAKITVVPDIPEPLSRLEELACNLRWAWDHESVALFRRLDEALWESTGHNPVMMLGMMSQERFDELTQDTSFMAHFNRVCNAFDAYMNDDQTWFDKTYGDLRDDLRVAYFSMEFGLTESFQNYSGGLGILSGDHLKSASDLGIPLIAMGLLYQEGYFRQYLNADGFQQESYPLNDFHNLPLELQTDASGKPILISVPLPGRELHAHLWKVQVGRIALYLLDSNIDENEREEDKNLTDRLYGGDRRTRIRQEILMGIGGIRALEALGLRPNVLHMNEGHSAFMILERIRQIMIEESLTFDEAKEIASAGTVFTTHTPVPAGLERFGFDQIDEHLTEYYQSMGLSRDQFLDLGREYIYGKEMFSMPVMAARLSHMSNGVAALHGHVSRHMWQWSFPQIHADEVPIGSVTNGIHLMTWLSREMAELFDRYLDPHWRDDESNPDVWKAIASIPDTELWRVHERRRERLVAFIRSRLRFQLERRGVSQREIQQADEVLNPEALTIGFARRFATYKRATLFMRDPERLYNIVHNSERPVQFIFAGKAHPHDTPGKNLIRDIDRLSRTPEFRNHLVFLEDYDMNIARYMYYGVDVWLNNPRRPKEASGTSGMKVIANGGLNFSTIDGWWAEGYSPEVGWSIGKGEEYPESEWELQDQVESEALYNVLEKDIVPLFYTRGDNDLPREWLRKVKASMTALTPFFNTRRMVREYTEDYYIPTYQHQHKLAHPMTNGRDLVAWQHRVRNSWEKTGVGVVTVDANEVKVNKTAKITAKIYLNDLSPEDVKVQVYMGKLNTDGDISEGGTAVDMTPADKREADGAYLYSANVTMDASGKRGVSVRILPHHAHLSNSFKLNLIKWA